MSNLHASSEAQDPLEVKMQNSAEALVGMAVLALVALAAVAVYRWQQRKRVRQVERCVRDYLSARYGGLPNRLNINCSDDPLWPVLVAFDNPRNGSRHSLQFDCRGPHSTLSLLAEKEERRQAIATGPAPTATGVR
jgi:hypothetical protein